MSTISKKPLYEERRVLRVLEKQWVRGERLINRAGDSRYNPFYHLGTLGIFLLIVLTVTGIYLTVFYRPGADRAFETVSALSATGIGALMRSVHRYASDALAFVIFLHAVKMFFHDRFWGNRWVAWLTGWVMLVNIAIIGVMGYWLVWDERAQWLTEYFIAKVGGALASSFLNPTIVSATFPFFVIVLFLHVFVPILLVLGLLLHLLRLERSRLWSPRWLMVSATVLLLAISIWRPATSAAAADLNRQVGTVPLDGWYLGFLPLVERWGSLLFWGLLAAVLGVLGVLPWIARGRHVGPAVVGENFCAGCSLCIGECPYSALVMHPRPDSETFELIAEVNPSLCTGCGLCVGTCSTLGIEMANLPTQQIVDGLQGAVAAAGGRENAPVVVFACQRHATLGTFPAFAAGAPQRFDGASDGNPAYAAGIKTGNWSAGNGASAAPLVTCTLPCVGMVPNDWITMTLKAGARATVMLACPDGDCGFREGPRWLGGRVTLRRRSAAQRARVHMLETAPGDRRALTRLLNRLYSNGDAPPETPAQPARTLPERIRALAVGVGVLAIALVVSMLFEVPATASARDRGLVRIALEHEGEIIAQTADIPPEIATKLPEGVSPVQVLGGKRYPVQLRLFIDGELALENTYEPRGLRHEGSVSAVAYWWVQPGEHEVRLMLKDNSAAFREVYAANILLEGGQIVNLYYVRRDDAFIALD